MLLTVLSNEIKGWSVKGKSVNINDLLIYGLINLPFFILSTYELTYATLQRFPILSRHLSLLCFDYRLLLVLSCVLLFDADVWSGRRPYNRFWHLFCCGLQTRKMEWQRTLNNIGRLLVVTDGRLSWASECSTRLLYSIFAVPLLLVGHILRSLGILYAFL